MLIYPTETFFALGCPVDNSEGLKAIYDLKGREINKPLPALGSSFVNLEKLVRVDNGRRRLGEMFWPGPLSILCDALPAAPLPLRNADGEISVRITADEKAAELCEKLGTPLVATSANISGEFPAVSPEDFSAEFMVKIEASQTRVGFACWPWQNNPPLPSTVVAISGKGKIRMLREGRITAARLREAGFEFDRAGG